MKKMKILFISQERRYERIVNELRKSHEVDYIFKNGELRFDKGDYHLPKLFGYNRGFIVLAYLFTTFRLLTKRYDVCLTDYKSVYFTTVFPVVRILTRLMKTKFIYDIRTIPVEYHERDSEKVEKQFSRRLRFADRFYQGITVITAEMMNYLRHKYLAFNVPVGIWESGVDVTRFSPANKNIQLKLELGFEENDFLCFYHGSVSGRRGIVELVQSFRFIKPGKRGIKLFILGSGEGCDKINEIISKYGLGDIVRLHDWVEYSRVPEFISMADLCIVPLPDIDWWRVSSPFKLMEYIACGKNILLTDMAAHKNVVDEAEEYFWVRGATPESFAEGIIEAYDCFEKDPDGFSLKGIRAREKFIDSIGWERRSQALREYLSHVTGSI
jgi:glycosyltransferase involved in cell wall biosynthesis